LHDKTYQNTATHAVKPPEKAGNEQEKAGIMAESAKNGHVVSSRVAILADDVQNSYQSVISSVGHIVRRPRNDVGLSADGDHNSA
jgi:hypothetical protein